MNKQIEEFERQEIIQKLIKSGYGDFVKTFIENESTIYTKKGARLNKSGACRALGCKVKQLEEKLKECRKILENDF